MCSPNTTPPQPTAVCMHCREPTLPLLCCNHSCMPAITTFPDPHPTPSPPPTNSAHPQTRPTTTTYRCVYALPCADPSIANLPAMNCRSHRLAVPGSFTGPLYRTLPSPPSPAAPVAAPSSAGGAGSTATPPPAAAAAAATLPYAVTPPPPPPAKALTSLPTVAAAARSRARLSASSADVAPLRLPRPRLPLTLPSRPPGLLPLPPAAPPNPGPCHVPSSLPAIPAPGHRGAELCTPCPAAAAAAGMPDPAAAAAAARS